MNNTAHTNMDYSPCPPCQLACPIFSDVRGYVCHIAERRFEEAFVDIRRHNPLPRVCGRICTHPCETACKRGQVDEPIAIAALKRFAADGLWKEQYKPVFSDSPSGHKVAVVGSGPAGLAAAHDLALLGHQVTIFEALPVLGGMLRVGVPEYRLPKDVLDEEIQAILDLGIEVKTGVRIGEEINLNDLAEQGYKAVFVGIGAHRDRKLGIAGEDELEGVVSAISFLQAVNQGENPRVGKKVAVIGGGNTAIDSARCALRLGAGEVHILYRRALEEMPAAKEVEDAVREGVQISYLTSPIEILGQRVGESKNGKLVGLRCIRNELGETDASGRRKPKPVPGSEVTLDVDMVIVAVGQVPDSSPIFDNADLAEGTGQVLVDSPDTLVTSRPGVFAGGDAVTGSATVVEAIGAGKRAAVSIDCYLRGKSTPAVEVTDDADKESLPRSVIERTTKFARCTKPSLSVEERLKGFREVESVLSREQATKEALRCLHCYLGARVNKDKCVSCLNCVIVCPVGVPATNKMGEITIDLFACQACGVCALECPVHAIEMLFHPGDDLTKEIKRAVSTSKGSVVAGFFDYQGNFDQGHMSSLKENYPNIAPVMVFGLRRIDTSDVLNAFECGADGVLLVGCLAETDPFPETRESVKRRMARTGEVLEALGLDTKRLQVLEMPEHGLFEEERLGEIMQTIAGLGPSPLREPLDGRPI